MYGYELGKAWRKRWVLRWRLKEFGNIANSCKCCLEANSRQQKQHSEMSVHQQISGWSVEFSSISQMMIGANDLVGKYEGQKTNKVAKYHQNAWRQKWQVWIGFKTPRVAGEAQWARVLCDHVFFSWGLARQHSFGYVNSKRLSWSEVIELQKLTGGNWQKWKRVFLTCPCHEIYRDEAVGLKSCKNTWKITIFVKMWNLGQYRENLIFCQ